MWGRIGRHLRSHVVAYVALFVALGGTSFAAGTARQPAKAKMGTIHACVTEAYKTLNLAGPDRTCPKGQRLISWNAQGRKGAPGRRGSTGERGPTGPAGADGAPGAVGPAGAAGAPGPRGAAGPKGPAGPAGADGATGPAGPAGADGATGPAGPAGADGPAGPAGPTGPGSSFVTATVGPETNMSLPRFNVDAAQGPSVTVDVPASGLIEVYAQARIRTTNPAAPAVVTVMDTADLDDLGPRNVPLPVCGGTIFPLRGILSTTSTTAQMVYSGGDGCGRTANPQTILLRSTPGQRTFRLFYAVGTGGNIMFVSNSMLAIAPRP
jgi:hypothetical protein